MDPSIGLTIELNFCAETEIFLDGNHFSPQRLNLALAPTSRLTAMNLSPGGVTGRYLKPGRKINDQACALYPR
jgi:hypothetical protein